MSSKIWSNDGTYQTIKEVKIDDPSKPIWLRENNENKNISLCVGTPVHSEVSIHYAQCLLELQKHMLRKGDNVSFVMHKSSLVTQGRNLTVASFLDTKADYLLFLDSDINIGPDAVYRMIEADKDVICIPYPLKSIQWAKLFERMQRGKIKNAEDLETGACVYPVRIKDSSNFTVKNGVAEITHAPAGCLLIKRSVFDKLIQNYPNKKIVQSSVVNGEYQEVPNYYNLFDTVHDENTQTYMGEDYGFCKLWTDIGGKIYALTDKYIMHVGEHQYIGRYMDEFEKAD